MSSRFWRPHHLFSRARRRNNSLRCWESEPPFCRGVCHRRLCVRPSKSTVERNLFVSTATQLIRLHREEYLSSLLPLSPPRPVPSLTALNQSDNWYASTYSGTYYLEADLHVVNGSILTIDGDDPDMDECRTLYIVSFPRPFGPWIFCFKDPPCQHRRR